MGIMFISFYAGTFIQPQQARYFAAAKVAARSCALVLCAAQEKFILPGQAAYAMFRCAPRYKARAACFRGFYITRNAPCAGDSKIRAAAIS